VRYCILAGVDSPFNSRALRIQQPGKLLPDRANYEIFDDQRRLVAIAAEAEAHTRRQVLPRSRSRPARSPWSWRSCLIDSLRTRLSFAKRASRGAAVP
jgi:hypothetical protein